MFVVILDILIMSQRNICYAKNIIVACINTTCRWKYLIDITTNVSVKIPGTFTSRLVNYAMCNQVILNIIVQ